MKRPLLRRIPRRICRQTRHMALPPVCLLFAFVFFAAGLFFASAVSARAAADDFLAELERRTTSIMTVRGEFSQETVIPMFAGPVVSTGRYAFKRPGAVRWEYESPMREGIVLDGEAGFRWEDDPAKRTPFTVRSDPLAAVIARQLVTWITFDAATIGAEYAMEPLSAQPLALRMTPRRDDIAAIIAHITITFRADGTASRVEIAEKAGGATAIVFGEPAVNAPAGTAGFVGDADFR